MKRIIVLLLISVLVCAFCAGCSGETEKEYDWTSLLRKIVFSDVKYIESYKAKEYE